MSSTTPGIRNNAESRQTAEPMAVANTVLTAFDLMTPREESSSTLRVETLPPIDQLRADLFKMCSTFHTAFADGISRHRKTEASQNALSRKVIDMESRLASMEHSMKELLALENLRHHRMEETHRNCALIAEWAREVRAKAEHSTSSPTP